MESPRDFSSWSNSVCAELLKESDVDAERREKSLRKLLGKLLEAWQIRAGLRNNGYACSTT